MEVEFAAVRNKIKLLIKDIIDKLIFYLSILKTKYPSTLTVGPNVKKSSVRSKGGGPTKAHSYWKFPAAHAHVG